MEEKLDKILSELENNSSSIQNLEKNQMDVLYRIVHLKTGQEELKKGQNVLTKNYAELSTDQKVLSRNYEELKVDQKELRKGNQELKNGQMELTRRQAEFTIVQNDLKSGQKELSNQVGKLETGQGEMRNDIKELRAGQSEIITIIKHSTTLLTENSTHFRKDMSTFKSDVNADIELLFNEVASVKRKVSKLEQSKNK
ncbi:hypothetical protein [Neobacillus sp. PS2-9]|uniref:hypothetical protein n=1 Tax=Neobacillus sp. PS2-9 TaxID=3070676 RepID=UPI0027E04B02|nr:hypothetical protein [Neobacillus sp. PS2-9]WML55989.1 hypothetical protein RCG25_13630 [Neobacillus sp. PS2-9]